MLLRGAFGKIPAVGDFVSHHLAPAPAGSSRPMSLGFDRWLHDGHGAIAQGGAQLPVQPTRFVFAEYTMPALLVGAMTRSHDAVGRQFPLAVFAHVPVEVLSATYPIVHIAFDAFFHACVRLLDEAASLSVEELRARVDQLPTPSATELEGAVQIGVQTLHTASVGELQERLFADVSDGRQYYAYHTFLTAVRGAGPAPGDTATTILDCPVAVDLDLFAWLELGRRLLRWTVPPTFFWLEEPMPRLLISLGSAPPSILQFLANPRVESQRLWPLTTFRPAAVETARDALGLSLAAFGTGSVATLAELVQAVEALR